MVLVLVSFSASSKAALWLLNAGCGDRVLGFDLRSLLLHMHGSSFVFCLGQRWHCRKARSGVFFFGNQSRYMCFSRIEHCRLARSISEAFVKCRVVL